MEENKELRVEEISENLEDLCMTGEGISKLPEPEVDIVFRNTVKIDMDEYKELIRKEQQLEILVNMINYNDNNARVYATLITGKDIM